MSPAQTTCSSIMATKTIVTLHQGEDSRNKVNRLEDAFSLKALHEDVLKLFPDLIEKRMGLKFGRVGW